VPLRPTHAAEDIGAGQCGARADNQQPVLCIWSIDITAETEPQSRRRRLRKRFGGVRGTVVDGRGVTIVGDDRLSTATAEETDPSGIEAAVQTEGRVSESATQASHATAWLFSPDEEPRRVDLTAVPDLATLEKNFVWVDLDGYTEAEFHSVALLLGFHRQAVRAVLADWQRPRLTIYRDHFFTSTTVPHLQSKAFRVDARELDLFVGHNVFVSVHKTPLPFADRLQARVLSSPNLVQFDAPFMLYIVLDELLAYYEELNRRVHADVERMEERALHDSSDNFLEDLLQFKRYAFALSQLADQHREIFAAFLRPDFSWISGEEVEEYFEDLETRLVRLLDLLLSAKDAVNGAFEIYVSHMSHRTNQVIKLLTMVSTVLLPATLIIGIFGTNISVSVQSDKLHTPLGLGLMLLCILLVSGGTLLFFRRRGLV
jgi:magnesium transporter